MEEYQATPIKEVKTENELKRTMGWDFLLLYRLLWAQ